MNPRVIAVEPKNDHLLELTFSNQEKGIFDLKPYLDVGMFSELKDPAVFYGVKNISGTVVWDNGLDICPDTLYLESIKNI